MRPKSFFSTFVLVVALFLAGLVSAADLPPLTVGLTPMKKMPMAPAMQLPDLDEETFDLATLKGKVVVVNFWATWCPPCRREMPALERLYQKVKDHGIEVVAVDVGEDEDTVFSFTGQLEPAPTFPMVLDKDAVTTKNWKVRGLPTTYIVDQEGRMVYRAIGGREFDHPDLVKKVVALTK